MKEELMRRISAALDAPDGLASDAALQEELRADAEAGKYAKDVTRIGKWLATWPLPEPDDASFEALATRIEQRLDEPLAAIADPTAPPSFDDDDAIRDATAGLLQSGEFRVSDSSIEIVSDPSLAMPAAPPPPPPPPPEAKPTLARVALGKARATGAVEEPSGVELGEPLSSAELELRLGTDRPKKKKKKKAPGATSTSSDRISIPTPKPLAAAPTLSPVVQLPRAEEKRPVATFWWFAAAAAVGLGVFGAATLFESEATPVADVAHGSTLVTSGAIAPTASPVVALAPPAPPPMPVVPDTVTAEQVALGGAAEAAPSSGPSYAPRPTPTAPPMTTVARAAHRSSGTGGGAADLEALAAGPRGRAPMAAPAPTTPREEAPQDDRADRMAAATPRTSTADTAAPAAAGSARADTSSLPETPDRSTIQAVLAGRLEAVRACAEGAHGLADVDIVIAASGRITTATVNGTYAGTPVGSCIARAVRAATFPPFRQSRFQVTYPYHF